MPDPNAQKANQQPAKSLEALVHAKNKRLLEELTKLRVSFDYCALSAYNNEIVYE